MQLNFREEKRSISEYLIKEKAQYSFFQNPVDISHTTEDCFLITYLFTVHKRTNNN